MTKEKIEEVIEEILGNFEVTDEPQHYQAYPCHITEFQNECIRERIRTEIAYLLSSHDTYWKERVRKEVEGMKKDEVKWKKAKYDVKSVEAVIWNRALDTLLDNLK